MLVKIGMFVFVVGLASWFWWATYADWQQARVPAARSLTKMHYAKRSETPVLFWALTIFRIAFGSGLTWQVGHMVFQLLNAR